MSDKTARNKLRRRARRTRLRSAGWMVQTLANRLNAEARHRLADLGLTLDQFIVMMALAEQDGVQQRALGARTQLADYTITRALDALSDLGYVERRPDPRSRRAHLVCLTEAGQARMPRLMRVIIEINAAFLAPLGEADGAEFLRLLSILVAADQPQKSAS